MTQTDKKGGIGAWQGRSGLHGATATGRDGVNRRTHAAWLIDLHATALRRWLAWDPPRLDEAERSLRCADLLRALLD